MRMLESHLFGAGDGSRPRSDVWSGISSILSNGRWVIGEHEGVGTSDLSRYLHAIKGKATGEEAQPPQKRIILLFV